MSSIHRATRQVIASRQAVQDSDPAAGVPPQVGQGEPSYSPSTASRWLSLPAWARLACVVLWQAASGLIRVIV